ncbi:MAG: FtsX-like permease family protein [Bryobacteraceae bacterium]|nr:FtsX-like permease family protein [Bryobacteraceae bacterium]
MGRFLPLIWKNALRNRRRSLLTIFSVGLSLCLLGVMMAIYYALYLQETNPAQALRITTRNRVSITLPMPAFYLDRILRTPGVAEAMPWQWFGGSYKDERDPDNFFPRFGVDPKKAFRIFSEMKMPEDQIKAFQSERRACIVGKAVAAKHGFKTGDRITITGDIYPMNLEVTVRGIYESELGSDSLFFDWEYVREALPAGRRDFLSSISILADSPESVPRIINAIDDQFRNATVQTRTETERAFALGFLNQLGNIKLILLSVCGAVTFTLMLVSANTMAMSVRERVREVGILKTLGFKPHQILTIILSEAALIAWLGGTLGFLLASGLCLMIRSGPAFSAEISTLSVKPPVAAMLMVVAIFVAVGSSLVPALAAARMPILDALRRTD